MRGWLLVGLLLAGWLVGCCWLAAGWLTASWLLASWLAAGWLLAWCNSACPIGKWSRPGRGIRGIRNPGRGRLARSPRWEMELSPRLVVGLVLGLVVGLAVGLVVGWRNSAWHNSRLGRPIVNGSVWGGPAYSPFSLVRRTT